MRSKKCGRKPFLVEPYFKNVEENLLNVAETFLDEEEKKIEVG